MNYETMRHAIILAGWPVLILGSIFFIVEAYHFYQKTNKLALGKLIMAQTISILVGMYSLGIVSTIYMFSELEEGVKVVLPVFSLWFITMGALYYVSRRWRNEAANINILYYRIKERTEKLKKEKTKLSKIAEHMSTGAVLLDTGGKPMFINREAKAITGSRSNNESTLLKSLYKKFSKYSLESKVKKCLVGEPSNIMNAKVNGRIYEIFMRCLVDHKGQAKAYFGHFIWIRDITEEVALFQSERSFLTVASHKLRTPLTGIKGFLDMTLGEKKGLSKTQKEYLQEAKACTAIMSDVVNQLLYASEAEIKKMKIKLKSVALDRLVKNEITDHKEMTKKYGAQLKFEKQKGTDFKLTTDSEFLRQAVSSVIENALIYSNGIKDAQVKIILQRTDDAMQIMVKDNGIGIPKQEQGKIFAKFYRAANALKVHTEGIGLNLSNVKHIIESIGGEIDFESKLNKGSTFTITLPLKVARKKLKTK